MSASNLELLRHIKEEVDFILQAATSPNAISLPPSWSGYCKSITMNTTKTAVQVTQELLALVTARQERLHPDKLSEAQPPEQDKTVRLLLDELSLQGDGVSASVDKSDPYFKSDQPDENLFRQAVERLRQEAGEIPESLQQIFDELK